MLVLTRKANERIYIGNNITITIARLEGHRVKVGIEAPPEILIRRAELVDQWTGSMEIMGQATDLTASLPSS
jgi:carbon storage regulator